MFASPMQIDNYLDGINYKAFAALFAEDYSRARTTLGDVAYQRKDSMRKAEMKPVEVKQKPAKKENNLSTQGTYLSELAKLDETVR